MERQASNMVHMGVRNEDIGLIHCSLRTPPGVKDQLQLRDGNAGLLHMSRRRSFRPSSAHG